LGLTKDREDLGRKGGRRTNQQNQQNSERRAQSVMRKEGREVVSLPRKEGKTGMKEPAPANRFSAALNTSMKEIGGKEMKIDVIPQEHSKQSAQSIHPRRCGPPIPNQMHRIPANRQEPTYGAGTSPIESSNWGVWKSKKRENHDNSWSVDGRNGGTTKRVGVPGKCLKWGNGVYQRAKKSGAQTLSVEEHKMRLHGGIQQEGNQAPSRGLRALRITIYCQR